MACGWNPGRRSIDAFMQFLVENPVTRVFGGRGLGLGRGAVKVRSQLTP
jgi:hypothetical protein